MTLKGNLDTFYLNSILQLLHNDKKTGLFQAKKDKEEVTIYFNDGSVIFAIGSRKETRLGYVLIKKGLISPDDLKISLQDAKKNNQALGKYLVNQKFITSEKLGEVLHELTEEIIFNLFLWEKGDFEYRDAKINIKGMINININILKIMLEASRRIDEISIFKKQIPDDDVVIMLTKKAEKHDEIKLNSAEMQMLSLIDGNKSIKELFEASGYDTFSSYDEFEAYKLLHSLISSGLVEKLSDEHKLKSVEDKDKKVPEKDYTALITIYYDIIQLICRDLENELGKQIFIVFDECKEGIKSKAIFILDGFQLNMPAATNIHTITRAMKKISKNVNGEKILFVLFNELINNLFDKVSDLLGTKKIQNLIDEIEKIFTQYENSRFDSAEITRIIKAVNLGVIKKYREQ